jgi:hypothetical protein
MADSTLVEMGVCNVEFNAVDLGYTKGFVKVSYQTESLEMTVDQMDTPIDELITKQTFEVTVPMAEKNLSVFESLFPGATLTTGGGADAGYYKLELDGVAQGSLLATGAKLVIKPSGGTEHDWLTLYKAVPIPSMEFAYEKENVRVYEIKFKAIPDDSNDWVMFGKEDIATS